MAFSSSQLTVPPGFPELLQGLAKEVLRNQPKDIIGFAYDHFAKMVEHRAAQDEHNRAVEIENTITSNKPNRNIVIPKSTQQVENGGQNEDEELPDLNSFDNNEVNAITKIQSGFRGMQARKQVKIKKQDSQAQFAVAETETQEQEEEEELPDLNSFNNDEVSAITKIQSGFRGMQARKQVKGMQENEVAQEVAQEVNNNDEEEELPDLNSFDDSEVKAIGKIQAGFRGMKARKEVKELKQAEEQTKDVQNQDEEEELPDLNSFDQNEVNAITKIQSGFRGMQARKEVKNIMSQEPGETAAATTNTNANNLLSPRNNELPPSTAASQAPSQAIIPETPRNESSAAVNIESIEQSNEQNENVNEIENNDEDEELPDLNSFDNNEVQAISKIQAGFRGMKIRKEMKKKDSDAISTENQTSPTDQNESQNPGQKITEQGAPTEEVIQENNAQGQNEEEELPDLNSFDNNEVNAITKIQAGFRGMQARKEVKGKSEAEANDANE